MNTTLTNNSKLLRLGGIAGIGAGLFVLSFAVINTVIGGLFPFEVFESGQINPWIQRVTENSELAQLGMALPTIGFSFALIFGIVLFKVIEENCWQKYLAISGYLIGVPITVYAFISGSGLLSHVLHIMQNSLGNAEQISLIAAVEMEKFMLINSSFGPFFILVLGNTFISISALKTKTLPKWLCYWSFFNGVLLSVGYLEPVLPSLKFTQLGGPLSMLWFFSSGITLIMKSKIKK